MIRPVRRCEWLRNTFLAVLAATLAATGTGCSGGGGGSSSPPPAPSISVVPATLTFADAYVGGTYTQTFAIHNGGPGVLTVTSVAADATALASGITATAQAVPFEVAASSSATVTVAFAPTTSAPAAGTIRVTSNDSATPVATVALSSTTSGTPALSICAMQGATLADGCSVSATGDPEVNLGTVSRGDHLDRVIALTNAGTGSTAVQVGTVDFDPAVTGTEYALSFFSFDGTNEAPATLPFFLTPTDPSGLVSRSELRVHVSFTAPLTEGAVSGESVSIGTPDLTPATTLVAIVGTVSGCPTGTADCDGIASNGCETTIASDLANCGACGAICGPENASPTCVAGQCSLNCAAGYANCDGTLGNGCETATQTDVNNCGACGTICSSTNGTASCSAGQCAITCATGFGNCDGIESNGCETNLSTSVDHCGSCSTACAAPPNATATCSSGTCGYVCNPGWADCDGIAANGCEVNITTNPDHCGSCSTTCSSNNMATRTCSNGVCNGTCATGFADCDANKAIDGCETNVTSDAANCGGCGKVCGNANATASCIGGTCQLTCNAGWANCDGINSNGCEINTTNDPNNCNGCGQICSSNNMATRTCTAGTCSGTCATGWGDCNGNRLSDGCETNLLASTSNCGYCGNNCMNPVRPNVTSAACSSGACVITSCTTGYYNEDNLFSDGCECAADGVGDTCGTATNMGTIVLGGSMTYSANIVPLTDNDYFVVTYGGSGSCSFHPKVNLSDVSGVLRIDVGQQDVSGCSFGALGCGVESGTAISKTTWEFTTNANANCWNTFGTVFYVRVYAVASATSCLPYTLTFSN